MNDLFESLEIADEMKTQLSEAFDKAVMQKSVEMMDEHVETKVNEAKEILEAEYAEKVEVLEDTLDGYMTSVVEEFNAKYAPVYEAEVQDAKAKKLLEMFDGMLKVAGIEMSDIAEAKDERDAELDESSIASQLDRATQRLSEKEDELIEARKEADKYLRGGIINETKEGLSVVEAAKFEKLAEMVPFTRDPSYIASLDTIKESILDSRTEEVVVEGVKLPAGSFKVEEVSVKDATDFSQYV